MYTEDFEGIMGFNEYEGDIEVIWNSEGPESKIGDYQETEAILNWPNDEPQFGDSGEWTVLNNNNDGNIWHPSTL